MNGEDVLYLIKLNSTPHGVEFLYVMTSRRSARFGAFMQIIIAYC